MRIIECDRQCPVLSQKHSPDQGLGGWGVLSPPSLPICPVPEAVIASQINSLSKPIICPSEDAALSGTIGYLKTPAPPSHCVYVCVYVWKWWWEQPSILAADDNTFMQSESKLAILGGIALP